MESCLKNAVVYSKKSFFKKYKLQLLLALVWWYVTTLLQIDRLFFVYDDLPEVGYWIKILYLLLLIFGFVGTAFVKRKIDNGDSFYIRCWYVFKVIAVIYFGLLLILWPGTWNWDDIWTLNFDKSFCLNSWQHILSGIYHMVMLQIIPTPGGIILMSCFIASVCVACVVTKIEFTFLNRFGVRNGLWWTVLKILPFISPPVIMYLYSGYRTGIYIILESVLLTMMLSIFYDKTEWSIQKIGIYIFLTAIVSTWRTEAFIYLPMSILIMFMNKKSLATEKVIMASLAIILLFGFIFDMQKKELDSSNYKNNYEIVSVMRMITPAIHEANKDYNKELLKGIGSIVDVDVVLKNPQLSGDRLFWWTTAIKKDYTKEQYKDFQKGVWKLIVTYPYIVWCERWNTFIDASCIKGDKADTRNAENNKSTKYLFKDKYNSTKQHNPYYGHTWFREQNFFVGKPVFSELREKVIGGLYCFFEQPTSLSKIIFIINWNTIIPLIATIIIWMVSIVKKQLYLVLILSGVLLKFIIVFLTEPGNWIMYHLSTYLSGYLLLFQGGIWLYLRHKNKTVTGKNING